ncbi:extracellular solute-binding protein [Mesorhizobium sp. J18]|uniref:extracellular solute-binding protein n=1 Tax=Mesorhizobium sp. J18 TaxID=935263 RepID=UPI0011A0085E|nr:extracellular solute-binding protein [Mesorhizobium sp. J18]
MLPLRARALEAGVPLHGMSAFGDLKYAPGFTHFDYVNPEAPKGGMFNFSPPNWGFNQNVLSFNTLNSFVRTGDAPPRMEMCFDSLMTRSLDEPDAVYGLLAESVTISGDGNAFTFRLRPEARFHDGTPLTAEDVAFTYKLFKEKGHPSLLLPLTEMTDALALSEHDFYIAFNGKQASRTILDIVLFPILSKAFFTENPFDSSQLKPPLGSGPYRVGRFSAGQSIEYERVDDYWGRDLPVNRGLNNFDRIRIEFYRDRNAGFEAFKKGNVHYRQEFTSRLWAQDYDFPAVTDKKVVKREFPNELNPSMQAWAVNQRRERFRDPRIREAIALCFDFEWTNRNLFYDAYERSQSTFERSAYKAEGAPSPEEVELLARLPGEIPQEAFGEPVTMPESDGSGRDRKLLQRASELLAQAGWVRPEAPSLWERGLNLVGLGEQLPDPQFVVNREGRQLTLELLVHDDVFVRVYSPFVENLRAVGIAATIRMVDPSQYQARINDFDFDMVVIAASFSATPTRDELQRFCHSRAADIPGTRNLPGTKSEAVDALLDEAGRAETRDRLTVVLRVLDRVLRARRDWIPNWHAANHRAAYWDMFGFKEPKPDYGFPVEAMWWYDEEKAKAIGKG